MDRQNQCSVVPAKAQGDRLTDQQTSDPYVALCFTGTTETRCPEYLIHEITYKTKLFKTPITDSQEYSMVLQRACQSSQSPGILSTSF